MAAGKGLWKVVWIFYYKLSVSLQIQNVPCFIPQCKAPLFCSLIKNTSNTCQNCITIYNFIIINGCIYHESSSCNYWKLIHVKLPLYCTNEHLDNSEFQTNVDGSKYFCIRVHVWTTIYMVKTIVRCINNAQLESIRIH